MRMIIHKRGRLMFRFKKKKYEMLAVVDGTVMKINKVNDPVFSQKMLGNGFAITTRGNYIYAPFDGEIVITFPSNHLVGIKAKNGLEIMIHIGFGTINEDGDGFHSNVKMGQEVKKGDILVQFDYEELKTKGYDMTTVVVFSNPKTYKNFSVSNKKDVVGGRDVVAVYKK